VIIVVVPTQKLPINFFQKNQLNPTEAKFSHNMPIRCCATVRNVLMTLCWYGDDCVDADVLMLMCWCVVVLMCWWHCIDVLICWCVGVDDCVDVDVLMCWCVDVMCRCCVDVLILNSRYQNAFYELPKLLQLKRRNHSNTFGKINQKNYLRVQEKWPNRLSSRRIHRKKFS